MDKSLILAKVIADINKARPGSLVKGSDLKYIKFGHVPTGLYNLDLAMGGGFPRSKIVHIYGPSQVGKSSLMVQTLGNLHNINKTSNGSVINIEGWWNEEDFEYQKKFSLDPDRVFIINEEDHENSLDLAIQLVKSRALDLLILDSAAGVTPSTEVDKSFGDNPKTATRASILDSFCRKLNSVLQTTYQKSEKEILTNPCAVVILNQLRTVITKHGSYEAPASGKALKYYSQFEIELFASGKDNQIHYDYDPDVYAETPLNDQSKEYKSEGKIGKVIHFNLSKSRGSDKENFSSFIPFYFKDLKYPSESGFKGHGFDILVSAVEAALHLGVINQKGAWYYIGEQKYHGDGQLYNSLRENKNGETTELYAILNKAIYNKGSSDVI